jgi:hypothetical protein
MEAWWRYNLDVASRQLGGLIAPSHQKTRGHPLDDPHSATIESFALELSGRVIAML